MRLFTRHTFLFLILIFAATSAKALTAGFTANVLSDCSPLTVNFTNTSSGATTYLWDLDNGTTSTFVDVSGTFIDPGTYHVTLTASNGTSSDVFTLTITVYPRPTVSFFANDTAVCPGSPVSFTSTTVAGVAGALTYTWNFGDGFTSTLASPTHTYATSGYENVTLVATNSQGCTSTLTLGNYIHVFTPALVSFSPTSAYFCHAPGHAVFANTTTGTGPLSYNWTFGDGGNSTLDNPTHDYTLPGSYNVVLHVTDGNGCTDSLVRPNYAFVGHLAASFTSVATACQYAPVTFFNTSTTHISSSWTFDGTGASTSDTAVHAFSTAGTHTIKLVVYDGYCYDTITHTINILPEPAGNFTWSPLHPCPAPATITFNATPAGTVSWVFGDGGTGTGSTTTHTYASNGIDTISMILTDGNGCSDTVVHYDTIRNLVFNIIDTPDHGCVPLSVNFSTNVATSVPPGAYPYPVTSYSWNLGEGPLTTAAAPTHVYTAVGIYTVTATIITDNGCIVHDTTHIAVGRPPTVTAVATPDHQCYHHGSSTFTATIVTGPVDVYTWNFGDGAGTVDSSNVTTHAFTHPGTFHVTVTPSYNGCIGPTFTILDSFIIDSPQAIIQHVYNCSPYTQVNFIDASLGDNSHVWIFGDGSPNSTANNPTHTYPAETSYTVTLATYNIASGCRDTITDVVNLLPPVPQIHADDTAVCQGDIVHFTPSVTGGSATDYFWSVNGIVMDNDTAANFTDTFHVRGLYTIQLVIKDQHACFDTLIRTNYIIVAKPIDTFLVTPPTGCAALHVIFTDQTTDVPGAYPVGYVWSYGDAFTASVVTPTVTHIYTAVGTYAVQEIVTDNIGCKDTTYMNTAVTVWKPHAAYYASNTFPCIGTSVHFTPSPSLPPNTAVTGYYWMFGDGDTSTLSAPNHVYTGTGAYTVKLVVFDVHGCSDTASYPAYINVTKPHAGFYMDDSFSICPPLSVHFFNTSTGATTYAWAFGDGNTSTSAAPSDLYSAIGIDTVRLIAVNVYGCRDTAYGHVEIYGYSGSFTYGPLTGCSPLVVTFHANVANVPNIIWDYTDGTTSSASAVDSSVHTYTTPGAYVPKLILSDNTGCQASSLGTDTIKVDGVFPGFTSTPHPVCVNTNITFSDTSTSFFSNITSLSWIMTDGTVTTAANPTYSYTSLGTFPVTLTVTDGWGCTGSITEQIVVHGPPTITTSPDTTVCLTDAATLSAYGGVSYTWAPAGTVSCNPCQTTLATPTTPTVYTVTGTDMYGCVNTDTVRVSLRTNTISAGWGDTAVCRNVQVSLHDTGGTTYTWSPGAGLSSTTISNPIAQPASTTTYTIIAQLAGCIPDTNYVTVTVFPLPTVDAGPNQYLLAGQTANLQATGTLIENYMWTPAITLSCDTCSNPLASMPVTTTYTVTVTSLHGCLASDTVTISVHCDESQIFVPNSFTPNGDGQNDIFYPRGGGVSSVKSFRIYNRWGELLFERENIQINDVSNAWDGTYKGGSPRADVYVYIIDAVCATGQPINLKGDVTIIR